MGKKSIQNSSVPTVVTGIYGLENESFFHGWKLTSIINNNDRLKDDGVALPMKSADPV